MNKISPTQLKEMLSNIKIGEDNKYSSWQKLNLDDFEVFDLMGVLEVDCQIEEEYDTSENYWSINYPIALEYFPNAGGEIYFDGSNYYLVYRDFGGHVPEKRCRVLNSKIIIHPDLF